ncbi:MAG: NAD-dependent succinate-semialdehyde dehydrogenase [Cytophagales bacterium]|nr:NAD-dependent succinate-semialdehyde dehydrogenase [Cytophagales bacterium]
MAQIESRNPYNQELLASFDTLSSIELNEKIELASHTFVEYRKTSVVDRKKYLLAMAKVLREGKNEYAEMISLEMGKRKIEALSEVEKCASTCEYYVEHADQFLEDTLVSTEAYKSFVAYEPMGVVLAVMPWNFPFWQVFRFAIPALLAGNVGLLKHASNVPQCALLIQEVVEKAGFPENVFQTLLISSSQVKEVIEHDVVKGITLTGSEYAGAKVAELAGKSIKKTVLELGGSDPFIVLEDANVEKAVETAIISRYMNAGQVCIAAKRFIVSNKVLPTFLEKFKEKVAALKIGNPLEESTTLAPMSRRDLVIELDEQVQTSVKQGAEIVMGGKVDVNNPSFYEATILTNVEKGMVAYEQELFGPVAVVLSFDTEEEAIRLANDSVYGLGASIWTEDLQKGEELARKVDVGCVFVNEMVKSDPRLPFGGVKLSGYGRELSVLGMREFMNQKTIFIK